MAFPYGAKDLLAAAGAPTSVGAQPYRDQMLQDDATVVRRLRDAGAVLCAKLAMVELAGGMGYNQAFASFTGPGRTPWDLSRWSGGSSSGSGAAVGRGPRAVRHRLRDLGLDPVSAAFCGVHRPPTHLRPGEPARRHGAELDDGQAGAAGADGGGLRLVLAAIAGPDPTDPSALPDRFEYPLHERRRRFRLGVLKARTTRPSPRSAATSRTSLAVLREFGDVGEDLELPAYPYDAMAGMSSMPRRASAFETLFESGRITELTAPEDRIGGYAGQVVLAKDYLRAFDSGARPATALVEMLHGSTPIVAPTLSHRRLADRRGVRQGLPRLPGGTSISGAANLCGVPGLFLMNGTGEGGLPTSLQLTGRAPGSEATLLAIGARYQHRTEHHRTAPSGIVSRARPAYISAPYPSSRNVQEFM